MDSLIKIKFNIGVGMTGMFLICGISQAYDVPVFLADNEPVESSSVLIDEILNKTITEQKNSFIESSEDPMITALLLNLFNEIPSSIAIHWGNPTGKSVKVLTALDCPYCAKQQEILKKLKNIHIEEYIVPQVDTFGHVDLKSAAVWCNADRLSALERAFNGDLIPVFDECNTRNLSAVAEFVKKYQLPVTPVFIKENGKVHTGFLSKQKLTQWLEEN